MAIKETIYGYYNRGKYIQYNALKAHFFPPEEATQQNINYLHCTAFTSSIYQELLNISVPLEPSVYINYAIKYLGSPEVVMYSSINSNNDMEMSIYSESGNIKKILNPIKNDVISLLEIGDIFIYQTKSGAGHAIIIYEIKKDDNGNVIDALYVDSAFGIGRSYVNTKIPRFSIRYPNGKEFVSLISTLYFNEKLNTNFEEGVVEGSLGLKRFSTYTWIVNINNTKSNNRADEYSILRFVQKNSDGNAVLNYKYVYSYFPGAISDNQIINLSDKYLDKIKKFNHIYIEKIVDKSNNNIVELGDTLNYQIIIKNPGKTDYKDDIIITENLSEFVTYLSYTKNETIKSFKNDEENKKLIWNIGQLSKGEEFILNYKVNVTSGKSKDIIKSTGLVGNIPSSVVTNVIGINLNQNQKAEIINNYEKLKNKYSNKQLINEIYKNTFNVDIKFDNFSLYNLINNSNLTSKLSSSISLNKKNLYYNAVLNNYYSSLALLKTTLYEEELKFYNMKSYVYFVNDKSEKREDFIYPEHFKTGDILIYINYYDYLYTNDPVNKKVIINWCTYEVGEYSYIYIEGKGFVGVNYGYDNLPNTRDDRNEFNFKYYQNNKLNLYMLYEGETSDKLLEVINLQTLFGKNYYAILRPSLCFNLPNVNNTENDSSNYNTSDNSHTGLIVFFVIFSIILLLIGLFILWKYLKLKKSGKQFNFNNLKRELI